MVSSVFWFPDLVVKDWILVPRLIPRLVTGGTVEIASTYKKELYIDGFATILECLN